MTTSPAERKRRTEQQLELLGVAVNPHLPLVEDEDEVRLRGAKDVAERAIILYVLLAVAHQENREHLVAWLKDQSLWKAVSPKEQTFLEDNQPSQQDIITASWRAESLWTLLWSLGYVERLELPQDFCDSQLIQQIMPEPESSTALFIDQASLRPTSEILDATDLIYRIHWSVVDADLSKREVPKGFQPGVVYERHYALNWLTWYADDWDDITTDT